MTARTQTDRPLPALHFYSAGEAQPLHLALFDSQSYAHGSIKKDFADGKLVVDSEMNILGTYKVKNVYALADKSFSRPRMTSFLITT